MRPSCFVSRLSNKHFSAFEPGIKQVCVHLRNLAGQRDPFRCVIRAALTLDGVASQSFTGRKAWSAASPVFFTVTDSVLMGLQGCIACHNLADALMRPSSSRQHAFHPGADAVCHSKRMPLSLRLRLASKLRRELALCLPGWFTSVIAGLSRRPSVPGKKIRLLLFAQVPHGSS